MYNILFIKNVSSSTSHKKTPPFYFFTSFRLSLRDFKKILPNTFIYELILIKIYMNTNIMNMQIFHLKVIEGHKSSCNFSVNPTLPLIISPHYVSSSQHVFL